MYFGASIFWAEKKEIILACPTDAVKIAVYYTGVFVTLCLKKLKFTSQLSTVIPLSVEYVVVVLLDTGVGKSTKRNGQVVTRVVSKARNMA